MNHEFQQYRFARIEGYRITQSRLQAQFPTGIPDVDAFEQTIADLLTMDQAMAPWRKSEMEQTGFREGHRTAVLEFYWAQRQHLRLAAQVSPDAQPRCRRSPSA